VEQRAHKQVIDEMMQEGHKMINLEDKIEFDADGNKKVISRDPMDSRNSDIAVDLHKVDGYTGLSTQKTFIPGSQSRVAISNKTNRLVKRFIRRLR